MLVAKRIRAKTVQLLFSRLQIILLQNNLVCYLKIIYIYLFLKKWTHRDFFTSQDPRPLALHTRWIGRVLGIISICYDSGGVSQEY